MTVNRQFSGAFLTPRSTPLAGRIVGGGSLCLLLTAQYSDNEYPVQVAGPPLILQGYIPAGAPGGAWSKVQAPTRIKRQLDRIHGINLLNLHITSP
jgi:hypothetical protein